MKEKITKKKKLFYWGIGLLVLNCPIVASATGTGGKLRDTKLVKGILALGNDAVVVLLLIEAVIIVALLVAEGIKHQSAADEDKAKHKKNMKTIAGTGILIVSFTSLVPVILGYFQ